MKTTICSFQTLARLAEDIERTCQGLLATPADARHTGTSARILLDIAHELREEITEGVNNA